MHRMHTQISEVVHIKAYQLWEGANSSAKRIQDCDYFRQITEATTLKFRYFRLGKSNSNHTEGILPPPEKRRKITTKSSEATIKQNVLPPPSQLLLKEPQTPDRVLAHRIATEKNSEANNYSHFPDDSMAFIKSNLSAADGARSDRTTWKSTSKDKRKGDRDRKRETGREREKVRKGKVSEIPPLS